MSSDDLTLKLHVVINLVQTLTDIDECLYSPCFNGGNCTNQNGSFSCACATGFHGLQCENGTVYVMDYKLYPHLILLQLRLFMIILVFS